MIGTMKSHGDLGVRVLRAQRMPLVWQLQQWLRTLPGMVTYYLALGFSRLTGVAVLLGKLEGLLVKADGTRVNLGVLGYKMVTTAFCTDLCSALLAADANFPNFDYHDCGTGVTAEAIGDTTLQTPYGGARTNGTPTNPTGVTYREVGTISFAGPFAITEHGLFKAAAGNTLFDRTVFSVVNVVSGDSIQFTYTFTATAGG